MYLTWVAIWSSEYRCKQLSQISQSNTFISTWTTSFQSLMWSIRNVQSSEVIDISGFTARKRNISFCFAFAANIMGVCPLQFLEFNKPLSYDMTAFATVAFPNCIPANITSFNSQLSSLGVDVVEPHWLMEWCRWQNFQRTTSSHNPFSFFCTCRSEEIISPVHSITMLCFEMSYVFKMSYIRSERTVRGV